MSTGRSPDCRTRHTESSPASVPSTRDWPTSSLTWTTDGDSSSERRRSVQRILEIVIVISKLLKHRQKPKRSASAYSRALMYLPITPIQFIYAREHENEVWLGAM